MSNGLMKSIIAPVTRTARRVGLLLDDGRQPVLRLELFPHVDVGLAHAGADDRPIAIDPGIEQVVEIDRLMGAVKVADADMEDAGLEVGPPVVRLAHARAATEQVRLRKV